MFEVSRKNKYNMRERWDIMRYFDYKKLQTLKLESINLHSGAINLII